MDLNHDDCTLIRLHEQHQAACDKRFVSIEQAMHDLFKKFDKFYYLILGAQGVIIMFLLALIFKGGK